MYYKLFSLQEAIFKVIANQKRLEIIQLLKNRELTVSEMVEMLGIRQANISQHLSLLRTHGVVTTRRVGLNSYYKLTDQRIAQATKLIREFLMDQSKLDPLLTQIANRHEATLYPVVLDPVCRMRISASESGAIIKRNDQVVFFCGKGCRDKYLNNPKPYELMAKEA